MPKGYSIVTLPHLFGQPCNDCPLTSCIYAMDKRAIKNRSCISIFYLSFSLSHFCSFSPNLFLFEFSLISLRRLLIGNKSQSWDVLFTHSHFPTTCRDLQNTITTHNQDIFYLHVGHVKTVSDFCKEAFKCASYAQVISGRLLFFLFDS